METNVSELMELHSEKSLKSSNESFNPQFSFAGIPISSQASFLSLRTIPARRNLYSSVQSPTMTESSTLLSIHPCHWVKSRTCISAGRS